MKPATAKPSAKRAKLCSIEHANRIAVQIADRSANATAVVKTGHPLQPFRVVFAEGARPERIVSRVVTLDEND